MNFRKKFYIILFGGIVLSFALSFLWKSFLTNKISDFTNGKMEGVVSLMGLSTTPVFKTGMFSEDGNYFAYTYQPDVERPDVDGSFEMRGIGFPTYFQIMETATGKKLTDGQYKTGKSDPMYVVWTESDWVWLMQSVNHEKKQLALYDLKANKYCFAFGELEKLNPNVDWKNTSRFYINTTAQKGLLLEANDKRNYRIDPYTGKAEIVTGKFDMLDYGAGKNFQTSGRIGDRQFRKKQINGRRTSITTDDGKNISEDDFIEVQFLTLSKNKTESYETPITFYKNNFFVLSPITSDNKKMDMELAMLEKSTLKTVWKIQLPQKELKTMLPTYGLERFYIQTDQLFVTNNDYLMTIDLSNGKIVKQESLYD